MGVKAVGQKTAVFLRVISETLSRYERATYDPSGPIATYAELGDYIRSLFVGTENEQTYLLLFDNSRRLMMSEKIGEGYSSGNVISMRDIALIAFSSNAASIALAHNHPNGKAIPSGDDIAATNRLVNMLSDMDIFFIDHFIVAGNKCVPIVHPNRFQLFNMPSEV